MHCIGAILVDDICYLLYISITIDLQHQYLATIQIQLCSVCHYSSVLTFPLLPQY